MPGLRVQLPIAGRNWACIPSVNENAGEMFQSRNLFALALWFAYYFSSVPVFLLADMTDRRKYLALCCIVFLLRRWKYRDGNVGPIFHPFGICQTLRKRNLTFELNCHSLSVACVLVIQ